MKEDPKPINLALYRGKVDETGQSVSVRVPRRRKRRKGWRDHVSLVDLDMITRLEMTAAESRLFWAIASRIPERGGIECRVTIAEIAESLEVDLSNLTRTMKSLRERMLIRTVRRGVHQVNPWLLYNGDFESWNLETDEWPEPVWSRHVNVTTGEVQ